MLKEFGRGHFLVGLLEDVTPPAMQYAVPIVKKRKEITAIINDIMEVSLIDSMDSTSARRTFHITGNVISTLSARQVPFNIFIPIPL